MTDTVTTLCLLNGVVLAIMGLYANTGARWVNMLLFMGGFSLYVISLSKMAEVPL